MGLPISENQTALWHESRHILLTMITSRNCDKFYPKNSDSEAVCCHVVVRGRNFGFCTIEAMLHRDTPLDTSVRTAVRRWRNPSSEPWRSAFTGTSYVDLFQVNCGCPSTWGLCSAYVCLAVLFSS